VYGWTLFFNLGAKWGWVVNATPLLLYHPERASELAQEDGLVWMGAENLIPSGILTPNHPVHSNLLY
jgi:hypothetical protein